MSGEGVAGGMHGGGVSISGSCMAGRHAWQGECAWQGACVAGGVHGREACMAGGGEPAWQERRPLQRMVRILLECFLFLMMIHSCGLDCFITYRTCFSSFLPSANEVAGR